MKKIHEVRIGQYWTDRDKRMSGGHRTRRVAMIKDGFAFMEHPGLPEYARSKVAIYNLQSRWRLV